MATNYSVGDRPSPVEAEYTSDPASGTFFGSDLKSRHEDLKQMLDSNKDTLKLEAMKRIIGMVAKGRNVSELFPAVVKNVVSSNVEVKKLVYAYLVRYAEEQQDLALLSISTFQRALKDPNPFIRACALRVLSSIRVPVIVPIMMLAIKEAVNDLSPYVRKTAAHAIPKLYNLDSEQKDELILVIEKLLSDKTVLVVGSAVMAFEEVCPERIDLIHKNYRKLCNLLVDVEEWGQVVIINMLTRYARTQFVNPNYQESDDIESVDFYEENSHFSEKRMDPDHRLLLRNSKILLQSRNTAVVLAVAQLYQHIAPDPEVAQVAKALVRLLKGHREIQIVVLTNVASLSTKRRGMFEPYLKGFFVRSNDSSLIKSLKLEILTNLATASNIPVILREFQTYISSNDKQFVADTIQAIGRCASGIKEITDTCLAGLVSLLSNSDEQIVGESVIVIRKLLQSDAVGHKHIISRMAKLLANINIPMARASILWLLGEYCEKVPKIAPDVLRQMAKTFMSETYVVKLQILTLAMKLYLHNPQQTKLLVQYILNMAKYDSNYDIRDRTRMLRALVFYQQSGNCFSQQAAKIFLAAKPPPVQHSSFKDREHFQLGTLSHFINARAAGYQDLPDFPEIGCDSSVRNVESANVWTPENRVIEERQKEQLFYSDNEKSDNESSSDESSDSEDSSSGSVSEEGSESEEEEESKESDSSSEYSEASSSEDDSSDQSEKDVGATITNTLADLNLILSLDNEQLSPKENVPSLIEITPSEYELSSKSNSKELLNKMRSQGLSIHYCFTRTSFLYNPKMTTIELILLNERQREVKNIKLSGDLQDTVSEFPPINLLNKGEAVKRILGIDFNDSSRSVGLQLSVEEEIYKMSICAPPGELLEPLQTNLMDFDKNVMKLKGMYEQTTKIINTKLEHSFIAKTIKESANVYQVYEGDNEIKFSAATTRNKMPIYITMVLYKENCDLTINCENVTLASLLLKDLKSALSS